MTALYKTNNNPRVIAIQKIYGKLINRDENLVFKKHRFKKFIKDVVNGTIERKDLIQDLIDRELKSDIKYTYIHIHSIYTIY